MTRLETIEEKQAIGSLPVGQGDGSFDESLQINTSVGRDIGYDYAKYGLGIPIDSPGAVVEGFKEGQHFFSKHHEPSTKYERKLVRLRLSAYRRNRVIDSMVTPTFLQSIDVKYCPITRIELTSGTGKDTDATVDRVFNGGGYAIGNITIMSQRANKAKGNLLPQQILEIAQHGDEHATGLNTIEWLRLACLTALSAPPDYPQSHLPLFVYPPNGIFLSNGFTLIQQCTSAIAAGFIPRKWDSEFRVSIDGKKAKKKFDEYFESLIGQISRRMRGLSNNELMWFAICDSWECELVFTRYIKFIELMDMQGISRLVSVSTRAQQSLKQLSANTLNSWSMKTRGYTDA